MHIAELWVYPVKSLGGQRLERATIDADGVPGDRCLQVRDDRDDLVTARTRHALLRLHATLGEAGEPLVDGIPWRDPAAGRLVRAAAGEEARLVEISGPARFDDTPLLIATDGAVATLGIDHRRLRPNLLIAGVEGLAERTWPGRRLRVGGAIIAIEKVCKRCVMPTIDPDTLAVTPGILARLNREFDGRFALSCHVEQAGEVAVGDPVTLVA